MAPSFNCRICGRSWSGSFNFSPCPNFFNHEQIIARRKKKSEEFLLETLRNILASKVGSCPPVSQITAFAEGDIFSEDWKRAMNDHIDGCDECFAIYVRLLDEILPIYV